MKLRRDYTDPEDRKIFKRMLGNFAEVLILKGDRRRDALIAVVDKGNTGPWSWYESSVFYDVLEVLGYQKGAWLKKHHDYMIIEKMPEDTDREPCNCNSLRFPCEDGWVQIGHTGNCNSLMPSGKWWTEFYRRSGEASRMIDELNNETATVGAVAVS